jgi:acid phosphatase (class A)
MRLRTGSVLLMMSLVALTIGAATPKPVLIPADAVDVIALLPAPPTLHSEENQAEVSLMLQLEKSCTPEQRARIEQEDEMDVFIFADVLGPWFNAKDCPQTAKLFDQIATDSKYFTNTGKEHWQRPRPYASYKELNPTGKLEKSFSYPSAHSTRGTLNAEILAEIFPDKRDQLLEKGRSVGWDRVIAGVHYPSDVAAGRVLGHALAQAFLASPDFKAQLAAVKAELQQASQSAAAAAH